MMLMSREVQMFENLKSSTIFLNLQRIMIRAKYELSKRQISCKKYSELGFYFEP
jgi:hypothetical protein